MTTNKYFSPIRLEIWEEEDILNRKLSVSDKVTDTIDFVVVKILKINLL